MTEKDKQQTREKTAAGEEGNGGSQENGQFRISPLSVPLTKDTGERGEKKPQEEPQQSPTRISQRELMNTISKRIDEKIDEKLAKRYTLSRTGLILLLLFITPLFFRAGGDLYDYCKSQLPKILGVIGITATPTPGSANGTGLLSLTSGKVVIIQPGQEETFSLSLEKRKIYEISGLDLDDPISSRAIEKISIIPLPS